MTGRKKLSDYWIDNKVPREMRKTIPLVFKDDDLIWMAGYQIHDQYKVSPSTKRLLRIELKKDA
jgi:tRNA(Ile)-lysidine synthase